MKEAIEKFVNENTNYSKLHEVSTKQVATHFNIDTKNAYDILCQLSSERKITKLDPVNGQNLSCCGWIINFNPDID